MRVFISKWFVRFARKERIEDNRLRDAIHDAERGVIDADYGGGVIKQRVARQDEGKSGGYRTIILFRRDYRSFFVYGFAKSDQSNISDSDAQDFKELAKLLLFATDQELDSLVTSGKFRELEFDGTSEDI